MQFVVLSSFILVYSLVILLCWRKAKQADHMENRLRAVERIGTASAAEANELSRPFAERFLRPFLNGFMKWLAGMMPQTDNPRLSASLRLAGIQSMTGEYNAKRLMVSLGTGLAFALLAVLGGMSLLAVILFLLGGVVLGLVFLRYMLVSRTRVRKQAMQKQLPEVLDLLSVSVEAGLGFDAALQRISDRARGPLITEFNATYREITLGRPRAEALRNFEQRCGLEEIKSFVGAIIQAEQLGISLKNVLKAQAQQMRLLKRQKVEEKAMKAPVKIIIPLVAFVFPVLFIILLGPAVISVIGMPGLFS
jgi:tight adherence protein C